MAIYNILFYQVQYQNKTVFMTYLHVFENNIMEQIYLIFEASRILILF